MSQLIITALLLPLFYSFCKDEKPNSIFYSLLFTIAMKKQTIRTNQGSLSPNMILFRGKKKGKGTGDFWSSDILNTNSYSSCRPLMKLAPYFVRLVKRQNKNSSSVLYAMAMKNEAITLNQGLLIPNIFFIEGKETKNTWKEYIGFQVYHSWF